MHSGLGMLVGAAMTAATMMAPVTASADATGLVAAYGFEEASGTSVVDSSATGNAGTAVGAARTTAGRFGRALSFDGVDDRVNVSDSASLDLTTGMTLEAWVNPTAATGSWRTVVIKEQPAHLAYVLYSAENNNRPSVHAYTNDEYDTRGAAAVPLNAWTHLAATYDGAALRLYVNGTQAASRALSGAMVTTSGALRIGGNAVWGEYFKGVIDEVRVYNRALTAGEIQTDMTTSAVPLDAPPAAPTLAAPVVEVDDVRLGWTAATDDVGVTGYRVHRSTTPGFTPSDANLLATRTTLAHVDSNLAAGTYHYKVVAVDTAGNRGAASNEVSATVLPDTTPPTGGEPRGCGALWGDARTEVWPSDDRGVASIELKLDGERLGLVQQPHWEFRWDTRRKTNGAHTLSSVVRDAAGNEATWSCEVTIDNPPMTVNFTSPNDGSTVDGTVTVAVAPRIGDNPTMGAGIRFKVDGAYVGPTDWHAPYEFTWDTTAVAEGPHELSADMWYLYPDPTPYVSESIVVTVDQNDTTPPTVPGNLAASVTGYDDVALSWSASTDNLAFRRYVLHRSTDAGFTPTNGNRLATPTGTNYADPDLAPGTYYYKIVAEDTTGNLSAPSNEATAAIVADTTPPTVAVGVGAGAGQCGVTIGNTARVSVTASDDRSVASRQIRLDGVTLSSASEVQWDTRAATDGPHVLTAVATDAAGNSATSAACAVTVSNPASPGLVAAYGFNEAAGSSVADASGTGNTGTISGATRTASGKNGGALSFDGTNDLVTVPDSGSLDLTNGMTLEAWVNPSALSGSWRTVLLKERPSGMVYALYAAGGGGRPGGYFVTGGDEFSALGPNVLPLNAWTHMAVTYDGATLRFFLNGMPAGSVNQPGAMSASTGALKIGGNNVWPEWFKGTIDDVRVYNRALTSAEIEADRDRPVGP